MRGDEGQANRNSQDSRAIEAAQLELEKLTIRHVHARGGSQRRGSQLVPPAESVPFR
jgi:hypothetical protein